MGFKDSKKEENLELIKFLNMLFEAYNNGKHYVLSDFSNKLIFEINSQNKIVERLLNNLINTQIMCINRVLN